MTSYLAPESPRLSSVVSESYFESLHDFPKINNQENICLFNEEYERELCFYLAKHIEANPDHRICLIGDEPIWTKKIQERLFLNKSIDYVNCKDKIKQNQYDRIILLNCLHKLTYSPIRILRRSLNQDGRLIIVYRDPYRNTLPLPQTVMNNWLYMDESSAQWVKEIYRQGRSQLNIFEQAETIKFTIEKLRWFSLLYYRMFYPLTLIRQKQVLKSQIYVVIDLFVSFR